jgi:hypothetical protein
VLEQAELELQLQDPPYRLVDPLGGDQALLHVLDQPGLPAGVVERRHGHVDAGVNGLGDGAGEVRGDVVVVRQRRHVAVVTDHDALEAEAPAQLVGEQEVGCGGRDVVDGPGVDHDGLRAGVDPARVGGQEDVLQVADRQLRLHPVVAVDRLGVAGEVLDRRRGLQRALALQPLDVAAAHRRGQGRLLRPGLVVAAPAVVPGQVLDRGEVPGPARRLERLGGDLAALLGRIRVPGRAHPDRVREQRRLERVAEAVDRVHAEDDRDVQPGVLDRVVLDRIGPLGPACAGVVGGVVGAASQDRAGEVLDQDVVQAVGLQRIVVATGIVAVAVGGIGRVAQPADHDLVHLADLLGQRHPTQQVLDAGGDRRTRVHVAHGRRGGLRAGAGQARGGHEADGAGRGGQRDQRPGRAAGTPGGAVKRDVEQPW